MSQPQDRAGACLVVGAGDGLGGATARAFAAEGLTACVTRRPRRRDVCAAGVRRVREANTRRPGAAVRDAGAALRVCRRGRGEGEWR